MLAKRIIPCLDVADGRVVKGVNFVDLKDAGSPAELARAYSSEGADELVFLDISASSSKRRTMFEWVETVAREVAVPLTVGGGIRTVEDIRRLLNSGADKVSINTQAVEDPSLIKRASKKYGSQCIVIAMDTASNEDDLIEIKTHGGQRSTGINAIDWARKVEDYGAGELLVTSVEHDGTTDGYDVDFIRELDKAVSIPIIASGGAGNPDHMFEAIEAGADAVLAASIFHYGHYSIKEVKEYLSDRGVVVRC